ncbi:HNH endonuclease [Allokutzneria sp. A3M-2-11 16]|uniref:HNH endonuclease signature motif containing protein n=1 Tax=Allokutzneria sp. A3M-2-11 16 TaxID=2962043 RepID=UPI0020B6C521|nr:HNH endonuclease signature motif containing protein [Allokutzneria sp. A3M-2-11 16]MCP3801484.1 HNH endonuclease [Allokutzneria sp. A3M-2-11 16]
MEINGFVDHLRELLSRQDSYRIAEDDILPALRKLELVQRLVTAASAELAAEAETRSLHLKHGCRTLAVLLRDAMVLSPYEARHRARLVHDLPSLPETRKALQEGEIQAEHVFVISDTLRAIPAEVRTEAEAALAGHARSLNHKELEKAGRHLRALVDPDGVFREEQEAIAKRDLTIFRKPNGSIGLRGVLDPEAAEAFLAAMHALAKPRTVDGVKDERRTGQRYADALTDMVRMAMACGKLPSSGGERAQVIVTISYEAFRDGMGTGWANWGGPMTAQLIRKIGCDARITPIVLDGNGVPLHLGRTERTAPPGLRKALAVRDKGCAFPGCDLPPAWTEAHHVVHWINGGETSLSNMVLLCSHHHHVLHQGDWEIRFDRGLPVFIPPAWVDTDRAPRRNIRLDHRLAS